MAFLPVQRHLLLGGKFVQSSAARRG